MQIITRWIGFCLCLCVAACVPTSTTPINVPPTSSEIATVEPTLTQMPAVSSELTYEDIQNASIEVPFFQQSVTLNNGEATGTGVNVSFTARLLPNYGIGDLNADGQDDLAVLVAENGGGSGVFVSMLVFLNQQGQPVQIGAVMVDDRPVINSLSIAGGEIQLEALVHNLNDEMTDPKLSVRRTYRLLGETLVLMEQTSAYDNGVDRSIQIDSPVDGDDASSTLTLLGSMPVAPFENNLSLTIFDLQGNVLSQSGFMVSADEPGRPATFNNAVDLPAVDAGTTIRIELADLSMADGSIITSKSILLTIK